MKWLVRIDRVLLILLCINTGLVKIFGMKVEVDLFQKIGITGAAFLLFGAVQVAAGVMIAFPQTVKTGSLVIIPTFMIATYALFASQVHPFSYLSLLFVAMAVVTLRARPEWKAA